jgi:hypothetical protein
LDEVITHFLELNRIVAIYEPADPLLNGHNLNLLFESKSSVWAEIIGPGFDASDLQRGDFSPHEVFSISLSATGCVERAKLVRRVTVGEYKRSREERMIKIAIKLRDSPHPQLQTVFDATLVTSLTWLITWQRSTARSFWHANISL